MKASTITTTALAVIAVAQQTNPTAKQIEIDIVFPRNETYREAQVFPIVLAIQNMTTIRESNATFHINWSIQRLNDGWSPAGLASDEGFFDISASDTKEGPGLFVGAANVTKWYENPGWGSEDKNKWMFQWYLHRREGSTCSSKEDTYSDTVAYGNLLFDVKSDVYLIYYDLEDADYLRNVTNIPECPEFATLLEIGKNTTNPGCSAIQEVQGAQGNPCAVKIDRPTVTSILSEASRQAEPTSTIETTASTSTSTAGVGPARTIQTALAAACVLSGLAL